LLLLLAFWLGLFCWTEPVAAQFHFKDYNHVRIASPDTIGARAVELVDAQTGQVLYSRNPNMHLLPASTTKLMTALVVYEKLGGFKGNVTISEDDRAEPSNIPVVPGETISVNKLFHALLIESCNDSARALGRYVAGSTPNFVSMMNQRALAMGLFNTHFYNPNGLPAPSGSHYTSCADLMVIFRHVLKYPELATIMSTKEYVIDTQSGHHILRNHNRLLGYYPGMGPAKTGWTVASRHTYACAVTQNGHTLLLTLLDSDNKWRDAQILFNWGFAQVRGKAVLGGGDAAPLQSSEPPAPSGMANEPEGDR
jgi:D-alanyl-D-alanine carboxypeptidase